MQYIPTPSLKSHTTKNKTKIITNKKRNNINKFRKNNNKNNREEKKKQQKAKTKTKQQSNNSDGWNDDINMIFKQSVTHIYSGHIDESKTIKGPKDGKYCKQHNLLINQTAMNKYFTCNCQ